jgi:putative holliday junction resolvase
MRYLGIDYGTKRLGLAISDEAGSFAFPREVIANDGTAFETLKKIIAEENVGEIVVGDTLSVDGGANLITARAEEFITDLFQATGVSVHRIREAWSSAEAMRFAPPGKRHDDSAAAAILLQRFLDSKSKSE